MNYLILGKEVYTPNNCPVQNYDGCGDNDGCYKYTKPCDYTPPCYDKPCREWGIVIL